MKRSRGFTLIELLVVVAIIMILSTLGIASFRNANKKARDSRRLADLEQIRSGLEIYRTDNGVYPESPPTGLGLGISELANVSTSDPRGDAYTYHPGPAPVITYEVCAPWESDVPPDVPNPCSLDNTKTSVVNP